MAAALLRLWCDAGCSVAAVAASLAFYPPTPANYTLEPPSAAERTPLMELLGVESKFSCRLRGAAAEFALPYANVLVTEVSTRRGRRVPVFVALYPGAQLTILFSHGNATDAGAMRNTLIVLALNTRCNVLFYDYTGYGPGAGGRVRPSEADAYADADAVYDYALSAPHLCAGSPERLVLHGQSIGSGSTAYLASRRPSRAVILESAIASGLRVLTWNRALLACCDIFPNVERMPAVAARTGAVLVMHGDADSVVSVAHGHALYDALPLWFIAGQPMREEGKRRDPSCCGDLGRGSGKRASGRPDAAAAAAAAAAGGGSGSAPTAPWFSPPADHNDLCDLQPVQYYLRLRRFLWSLGATGGGPPVGPDGHEALLPPPPVEGGAAAAAAEVGPFGPYPATGHYTSADTVLTAQAHLFPLLVQCARIDAAGRPLAVSPGGGGLSRSESLSAINAAAERSARRLFDALSFYRTLPPRLGPLSERAEAGGAGGLDTLRSTPRERHQARPAGDAVGASKGPHPPFREPVGGGGGSDGRGAAVTPRDAQHVWVEDDGGEEDWGSATGAESLPDAPPVRAAPGPGSSRRGGSGLGDEAGAGRGKS